MKKACFLVLVALMVSFLSPVTGFAGQSQQTPAPVPGAGQGGDAAPGDQGAPADQNDQAGQVGQGDDAGQSDQAGQADQVPGQKKGCGLWQFIKKLFAKDPAKEAKQAELLKKLLVLADKDLELALNTLAGKEKSYKKVIPAVGHLNHALSALGKAHPPKHLKPAFKQLSKRISHAKFYLVAFDFEEASARIESAKDYIGQLD